jgi:signal transduction histidine kinase
LGLGLSFVAWIVKVHGGTIHVTSKPGTGTRFTVKLPAREPPVADEP